MHMKHGASAIRAIKYMAAGLRDVMVTMCLLRIWSNGIWWDAGRQENEKYFEEAAKDPAAESKHR